MGILGESLNFNCEATTVSSWSGSAGCPCYLHPQPPRGKVLWAVFLSTSRKTSPARRSGFVTWLCLRKVGLWH